MTNQIADLNDAVEMTQASIEQANSPAPTQNWLSRQLKIAKQQTDKWPDWAKREAGIMPQTKLCTTLPPLESFLDDDEDYIKTIDTLYNIAAEAIHERDEAICALGDTLKSEGLSPELNCDEHADVIRNAYEARK